ncbi:hypothetical protein PM8797T_15521 [Gimesia maris DSM 8797]|nr:hypothetical protein PM8797T_15521 [Gimesia maris DSM 8797]
MTLEKMTTMSAARFAGKGLNQKTEEV